MHTLSTADTDPASPAYVHPWGQPLPSGHPGLPAPTTSTPSASRLRPLVGLCHGARCGHDPCCRGRPGGRRRPGNWHHKGRRPCVRLSRRRSHRGRRSRTDLGRRHRHGQCGRGSLMSRRARLLAAVAGVGFEVVVVLLTHPADASTWQTAVAVAFAAVGLLTFALVAVAAIRDNATNHQKRLITVSRPEHDPFAKDWYRP